MREWIRAGPVGREREGGRASGRWGTHLRRLLYRGEGRKRGGGRRRGDGRRERARASAGGALRHLDRPTLGGSPDGGLSLIHI